MYRHEKVENLRTFLQRNWDLLLISFLFILWALAFIYRSAYIASDGRLYFALFDDAMISMRYAWNFAHGHGLVWNSGEHVEGYTNLLMTLVMAVSSLFFEKRYAVLAIQLGGIFLMLATAFVTMKIFQLQRNSSTFAARLLFIIVLLYYPLTFWSLMGMETGLLAFLLSLGVLCALYYYEKLESRYLWLAALSFGLAYLARNDSIIFAAPVFLYLIQTFKGGKKYIYPYLMGCFILVLFPIGQTLFRTVYYDAIVPNTYTLKLVGIPLNIRLMEGWRFVKNFLGETKFMLLLAMTGLAIRPSKRAFLFFSLFLTSVAYEIYVGGDPWAYWRIMAPTMPFLFLLAVSACENALDRVSAKLPRNTHHLIFLLLILSGMYLVNSRFIKQMALIEIPYDSWDAKRHIELSIFINRVTREDATIGVFWAGTLPYYVDRRAIDFLGKSDAYIANLPPDLSSQQTSDYLPPGHNKYDLTYSIQTLLPTYVEGFTWGTQDLTEWRDEHYVKTTNQYVELYLLKDSPDVKWDLVKIVKQR